MIRFDKLDCALQMVPRGKIIIIIKKKSPSACELWILFAFHPVTKIVLPQNIILTKKKNIVKPLLMDRALVFCSLLKITPVVNLSGPAGAAICMGLKAPSVDLQPPVSGKWKRKYYTMFSCCCVKSQNWKLNFTYKTGPLVWGRFCLVTASDTLNLTHRAFNFIQTENNLTRSDQSYPEIGQSVTVLC